MQQSFWGEGGLWWVLQLRLVEFVVFQNFSLNELASAMEVFRICWHEESHQRYTLRVVSNQERITSDTGIAIPATQLEVTDEPPDILVLIGGSGIDAVETDLSLLKLLSRRAETANRVSAISSGVRLLLRTDMARYRNVVMHWQSPVPASQKRWAANVNTEQIYLRDGEIWTAVSASASVDMFLAIISIDIGAEFSRTIARQLTLDQIRGAQFRQRSPFIEQYSGNEKFEAMHDYIRMNLTQNYTTDVLAELCRMSPRNFMRRYKDTYGVSPAKAVNQIRTQSAANLLSDGKLSSQRVARLCGFGSEETMRRNFTRVFGVSPQKFRLHGPVPTEPVSAKK